MTIHKNLVNAAIAGAISIGLSMHPNSAVAKPPAMEKCYGVVKAGKNDCGSAGSNACAGQSKRDDDPAAWILVPKGTCDKIVGGSTTPKSTANNQK